ncbi:hypothetical protein CLG96_08960 [Sphingomonas oleivorans]|uniref:Ancillary SecYEG translocon subunit/Cell division coordinator CpoB TPR domain-containing protein n=1 Tax=Sphingomonas oleivorans TaxID=1735121 RepID=A0A2T5FYD9_9SPHN|nr:tetratricopeptide repeat protein [Sphingomonas oleivorans]PTQ11553.1 hypothetical protein CLG96_08960 [Sphingomonas oleivorans]
MALTPQNEDAFFREVDEELRREQLKGFWQRYGRILVALIVIGLAALAAFLWWQADRAKKAGLDSEQFTQAIADLNENKANAARSKLDPLVNSPRDGYRAAAKLTLAASAVEKGDMKGAAAAYRAVAADASLPQEFRDLALVRGTAVEFDTLPPAAVIDRLKPLAVAGNPWFGSAGEMTAMAHLKMNRPQAAAPIFAALQKDETVPETIRQRAQRMAALLAVPASAAPAQPASPSKE